MNKEKEIEEMAKVLFESGVALDATDFAFGVDGDDHFTRLAIKLVNVGFGNVKQAVNDFAERLKEKFSKRISALKNSEEECQEVGDWETAERCKVAYNEIENILNGFNQLITELYGADE